VNRSDLLELHFITMIANVPTILEHGILCHHEATKLNPASVAMPEIQEIREGKVVPGGLPLHKYANLYFHARNPMLYLRKDQHVDLCVLRISPDVLDLPGVVITDGNAASGYTAFLPSPEGLSKVERDLVYAEYWTDEDQIVAWTKKRVRCAEVLVPSRVEARFILGAYVSCQRAARALSAAALGLDIRIDAHLFFR